MNFNIKDMRIFANRHRGKNKLSGPHWSTIIRFPILFDEYKKMKSRAEQAEAELAALREQTRWRILPDEPPDEKLGVWQSVIAEWGDAEVGEVDWYFDDDEPTFMRNEQVITPYRWRPLPDPPEEEE